MKLGTNLSYPCPRRIGRAGATPNAAALSVPAPYSYGSPSGEHTVTAPLGKLANGLVGQMPPPKHTQHPRASRQDYDGPVRRQLAQVALSAIVAR